MHFAFLLLFGIPIVLTLYAGVRNAVVFWLILFIGAILYKLFVS